MLVSSRLKDLCRLASLKRVGTKVRPTTTVKKKKGEGMLVSKRHGRGTMFLADVVKLHPLTHSACRRFDRCQVRHETLEQVSWIHHCKVSDGVRGCILDTVRFAERIDEVGFASQYRQKKKVVSKDGSGGMGCLDQHVPPVL